LTTSEVASSSAHVQQLADVVISQFPAPPHRLLSILSRLVDAPVITSEYLPETDATLYSLAEGITSNPLSTSHIAEFGLIVASIGFLASEQTDKGVLGMALVNHQGDRSLDKTLLSFDWWFARASRHLLHSNDHLSFLVDTYSIISGICIIAEENEDLQPVCVAAKNVFIDACSGIVARSSSLSRRAPKMLNESFDSLERLFNLLIGLIDGSVVDARTPIKSIHRLSYPIARSLLHRISFDEGLADRVVAFGASIDEWCAHTGSPCLDFAIFDVIPTTIELNPHMSVGPIFACMDRFEHSSRLPLAQLSSRDDVSLTRFGHGRDLWITLTVAHLIKSCTISADSCATADRDISELASGSAPFLIPASLDKTTRLLMTLTNSQWADSPESIQFGFAMFAIKNSRFFSKQWGSVADETLRQFRDKFEIHAGSVEAVVSLGREMTGIISGFIRD